MLVAAPVDAELRQAGERGREIAGEVLVGGILLEPGVGVRGEAAAGLDQELALVAVRPEAGAGTFIPAPKFELMTPMWMSGRPPWMLWSFSMSRGKFAVRLSCSCLMESELSIMNTRSRRRPGLTSYTMSVSVSGAGAGSCSGCEVQAQSITGRVVAPRAHRMVRQRNNRRKRLN